MSETEIQPRNHCRHIHPSGHRCGSPALRPVGNEPAHFCYYHHTSRPPISKSEAQLRQSHRGTFTLLEPDDRGAFTLLEPDDRTAIQLNLGEIIRRIAANDLDPKRAGLLLYALQIAASNLPKPTPQTHETIDEITLDDQLGPLAPESEFHSTPREKTLEQILREQWKKDEEDEAEQQNRVPHVSHGTIVTDMGSLPPEDPEPEPLTLQAVADPISATFNTWRKAHTPGCPSSPNLSPNHKVPRRLRSSPSSPTPPPSQPHRRPLRATPRPSGCSACRSSSSSSSVSTSASSWL